MASYQCIVYCYPEKKMDEFKDWLGNEVKMIPQRGDDLGTKQFNAFADSRKPLFPMPSIQP